MVMLGGASRQGGFRSGHRLSQQDKMKAERTRLINKALKQKGMPTLTASQKQKLNRGEITEKQLLKGAGLLGSLGSIGDSIFGLGEGGFDDTMQYVAGGARRGRPRKMKGSGLLGSLGAIGDSVFGLGEGGVAMGGAVRRRGRPSARSMQGAGIFSTLASLAKKGASHGVNYLAQNPDLVHQGVGLLKSALGRGGVAMGGVEMGGAVRRRGRGRPRKMKGSGLLGSLGDIGDSVFGLGGARRGRGRPRKSRGGVAMGGFDDTMQYVAGGAKKRSNRGFF